VSVYPQKEKAAGFYTGGHRGRPAPHRKQCQRPGYPDKEIAKVL